MNNKCIKVLLIEDDEGWRSIISNYLDGVSDIQLVSICDSAETAFEIIENNDIDIILLDIDLSILEYNGIDLALRLKTKTKAKIIMFTISEDKEIIESAIFAGAVDYVIKSQYKETLVPTIKRVLYSLSAGVIAETIREKKIEIKLFGLTKTERKVFDRCCEGENPEEIQKEFEYQPQSYWNCIGKIKKKLNVESLKDVISYIKNHS